jgi:uncharacterized protein YyaL (SSP411 family)
VSETRANRLGGEASPYLLQHAHNPVDWYPWVSEALERAKAEDRPILLSIGYAACHWCHVMERESFEDEETAALMNEHFVSIKVDREERPDIDGIYMDAVQAMNGHGGWPLTAFLTPEGKPFYVGTYYPPEPRGGLPSFRQVLTGIAEAWRDRRDEIEAQAGKIVEHIATAGLVPESSDPLDEDLERAAFASLVGAFDRRWGGFGGAPKFPQPMTLDLVLRCAVRGWPDALEMLTLTLDRMAEGGIHDQVGGGFARYATDAVWHVPHFEKMLYDNAQLARVYARAWQLTGAERYRVVATRTLDYLLREMQHPEGGFFSSQDADSEGVEGKYFVWSWDELVRLVGPTIATAFGALPEGNWEGTNVLWRPVALAALASQEGRAEEELEAEVEDARAILLAAREERVRPGTDDKILTAWNAMAVSALAEAGRAFGVPAYVDEAVRCADFLLGHLRDDRGRLLRSWRNGVAGAAGYVDDYSLLADACLTMYETTFELRWFTAGRELADEMLRLFRDEEHGGFFTTGSDAEALVIRPKDLYDNAVPSGNSVAADMLQRLAWFTGASGYEDAATSALKVVRDVLARAPSGFGYALCALDRYVGPGHEVAIVGDPSEASTLALVDEVTVKRFLPNVVLAVASPQDQAARDAVALLQDRPQRDGLATAYVCERFVCQLPVTDPAELVAQLGV